MVLCAAMGCSRRSEKDGERRSFVLGCANDASLLHHSALIMIFLVFILPSFRGEQSRVLSLKDRIFHIYQPCSRYIRYKALLASQHNNESFRLLKQFLSAMSWASVRKSAVMNMRSLSRSREASLLARRVVVTTKVPRVSWLPPSKTTITSPDSRYLFDGELEMARVSARSEVGSLADLDLRAHRSHLEVACTR